MKNTFTTTILLLTFLSSFGQKAKAYFGEPIFMDSTLTVLIPIEGSDGLFSKLAGYTYSNFILYNAKTDEYKKIFPQDQYITYYKVDLAYNGKHLIDATQRPKTGVKNLFFFVNDEDYNASGKITSSDPSRLYVCDAFGNNLKVLTQPNENVVDMDFFYSKNIALIKIQRDTNNDKSFDSGDTDYYYVKLDLTNLTFGKPIEIK